MIVPSKTSRIVSCLTRLVMLAVFLVAQGCALNPVTGRPDLVLVTTHGERGLGEEAAREVEQSMGLTDDPQLVAYVRAVGKRLAQYSPRKDVEYEFYVVELAEPNAFALPGGFVYVSRGLLPLTNSEDELANVIGHEIGHVAARHSVKRISTAAPFAIIGGITGSAVGIVSDRLGSAVAGISGVAGSAFLAPYSRSQEREADRVGTEMAAKAGWNPMAMATFLATLQRDDELKGGSPSKVSFFDSHPATPERVEDTAKLARALPRNPSASIATGRAGFLTKLDGLIVGENPAQGVFTEHRFLHPVLNFSVEFPSGWEGLNSPALVAALAPEGTAFTLLQVVGEGDDPMQVPKTLEKNGKRPLMDRVEQFTIGGLPAARLVLQTKTNEGPTTLHLTWIAYQGVLYQFVGATSVAEFTTYEPFFSSTAASFRALTSQERASIPVTRLRTVKAQEGETLDQLVTRSGTTWAREELAVANGLRPGASLRRGQLLKVAIQERYSPR